MFFNDLEKFKSSKNSANLLFNELVDVRPVILELQVKFGVVSKTGWLRKLRKKY